MGGSQTKDTITIIFLYQHACILYKLVLNYTIDFISA